MKALFLIGYLLAAKPHTAEEIQLNADFHRKFDRERDQITRELAQNGIDVKPIRRECYGFITIDKGERCAAELRKAAEKLPHSKPLARP